MSPDQVLRYLVSKHNGSYRAAILELAGLYLEVSQHVSAGYIRLGPESPVAIPPPDPPPVCDDSWVRTGAGE